MVEVVMLCTVPIRSFRCIVHCLDSERMVPSLCDPRNTFACIIFIVFFFFTASRSSTFQWSPVCGKPPLRSIVGPCTTRRSQHTGKTQPYTGNLQPCTSPEPWICITQIMLYTKHEVVWLEEHIPLEQRYCLIVGVFAQLCNVIRCCAYTPHLIRRYRKRCVRQQ